MKKVFHLGIAALSLMTATESMADSITNLQVIDGSGAPTATISYNNASGTGSISAYVYADPQVSGGTTTPLFYCVDLWHDNYIGQSYTITQVPTMAFADSTFTDADNRIGWLLSQDQSTADARAAVQLAVWYTVDNTGFSMSTGDSAVTADYNALIGFAGYNSGLNYAADFWQATHDQTNTLYQDLVSAPASGVLISSVPEPGGFLLAAMGMLLVGLHLWSRGS
jgi:hypothetical protein